MPSGYAQRFRAAQDATSGTQAGLVAPSGRPDIAQWGEDVFFDFIIPSQHRTEELDPAAQDMGSRSGTNPFTTMSYQSVHRSAFEITEGIIRRPLPPDPQERLIVLQRWEGAVVARNGTEFTAILRDLTEARQPEEEVTISFAELADDDRTLVAPGAVFYWTIGYKVKLSGNRERVASLRVRRLPAFRERD